MAADDRPAWPLQLDPPGLPPSDEGLEVGSDPHELRLADQPRVRQARGSREPPDEGRDGNCQLGFLLGRDTGGLGGVHGLGVFGRHLPDALGQVVGS